MKTNTTKARNLVRTSVRAGCTQIGDKWVTCE